MLYCFIYWFGFFGCGEYICLVLEEVGVEYVDMVYFEDGINDVFVYNSGE